MSPAHTHLIVFQNYSYSSIAVYSTTYNNKTNSVVYISILIVSENKWQMKRQTSYGILKPSLPLQLGAYDVPKVNPNIFIIFSIFHFLSNNANVPFFYFSSSLFWIFWIFRKFSLIFFSVFSIVQSLYNEVQHLPHYIISTCFCVMYDWKSNFWLHNVMSYWEESALSHVFFSLTVAEEVRNIVFLAKN